jgi:putative transposase
MKKLNGGYAKYFNEKNKRTGTLFERKLKSILIENQAHFIHLPYYIHLNPLDLIEPEWRERKIKDFKKTMKFLDQYRWSSHLDYLGKTNFPSIIQRNFLLGIFEGERGYERAIKSWLKQLEIKRYREFILE